MKRFLAILIFLGAAWAQNTPTIGVLPDNGPSLPATCVIGQIYFRTATTVGLNQCNPANTWTALVAGGGAGVTSVGLTVNGTSPSGIFTISGSPVTTSGTLDVALAGTSGGIPYFSSGTVLTSSTAPAANTIMLWKGAAAAPSGSTGLTTDGTAGLNVGATGVGGTITLFGATSGSNTLTAPGNGTQLTLNATTVLMSGASGTYSTTNALTLTSGAGTMTLKAIGGSTANSAAIDTLPTNSLTATSGVQVHLQNRGTFAPTSGTAAFIGAISNPTINQTGGANGAIRVLASYPVNTALVGTEYLIAAGTSSATGPTGTLTDKFLVDSNGATTASSTITAPTYASTTNCAAVGTAASPSVASCSAAPAGAFSCATNASAATCTINTTAVTANSVIIVQEVASEGTRLSVTCNTAPTVTPSILLASKSAGVSFTINMPTITTNPACFDYWIIN